MAENQYLVDFDLHQNELQNAVIQNLAAAPVGAKSGQIWYNTTNNYLYFYNGTTALPIGYLPIATAEVLGGVKIGLNVNVASDGTISVNDGSNTIKGLVRFATDSEATSTTAETVAINPKQLNAAIATAQIGALIYKGTWNITSATDFSGITLPVKQGWMYMVTGTGPKTIGGIEWNSGDYIVMDADVAAGGTITQVSKIDNTESSDIVRLAATQTLTNKTIDADNNTISNLETDNFKSGVIVTEVGSTGTDTSLPTEQAVREALTTLDNKTQDKVTTAVENNIATWDASGNTKDSGKAFTTTVAATGSTSDNKIPTETATRSAITNAIAAMVFTAANPSLTSTSGLCTWTVTNQIGTQNVIAIVKETSTGKEVECAKEYSASTITIKMNSTSNIAAGIYTVVVLG